MRFTATPALGRGTASAVRCWQVQSCDVDRSEGSDVSRPDFRPAGWYVASARSTVMAALVDSGELEHIFYSTRLREDVDAARFQVPWWYRTTFMASGPGHTTLRLDGVIHKADLWVNGAQVAGCDDIAGAYAVSTFDVSDVVQRGTNSIAVRVHPGSPMNDLSIGWVDWNQWPPDNNMGIWRDVVISRTGEVRLSGAHVRSDVRLPALDEADLTIEVDVHSLVDAEVTVDLRATVVGPSGEVHFGREVTIAARATETVAFSAADTPALAVRDPSLWWPVGEGLQTLYDLQIVASTAGLVSDQLSCSFGIRRVEDEIQPGGGRRFVVNGRPVQIIGGGWSPDMFLRHDPVRMADELAYAVDVGFNALRLEGKLENPEFFAMTDALGLMVIPGWECCNKWEAHAGTGGTAWSEHDYLVAGRSMASEARLLRNHPSVIAFVIGSDFAPPPRTAAIYVQELRQARWDLPVVSAATTEATEAAGPSGMKMTGPYAWVPPVYWYSTDPERGGAVGFNSETGAGNNIPRATSLERMLSPEELDLLWRDPEAKQFHAGPPSEFDDLAIFHHALSARYGAPVGLDDFLRKAQLANYEAARAQFEAFASRALAPEPATGVIYWMFNSAWPSLNWQLYDWYLDPGGAYFGAKKANEPLHVQYAYDRGTVQVVNHRARATGPFVVGVRVRDLSGQLLLESSHGLDTVPARGSVEIAGLSTPEGVSRTYFADLSLRDGAGELLSRNVYWLSTSPDVLDWERSTWQYTPACGFADLRGLQTLTPATVEATPLQAPGGRADGWQATTVTLRNAGAMAPPAVGVHASFVRGNKAAPVLPVLWSDNDVTLFAGEEVTLTARYPLALGGEPPHILLEGFNLVAPTDT
jgi:exo-1,4-beta-D-glucosaminidase